ncbi:hypothetical protein FDP22_06515 [Paroceanicella profunda]|uniref:Uncharacterized protein n=2 Tax=Paroceanicella profunda TaxID=2579971 RepID=A0A5B8G306_9RHOB|nr:hypothetical protein FDP22_06515 [Paroceanicella profunda]
MPARQRGGNAGASALPRRRRTTDPMAAFDRLPPDLRAWLAGAARPWSPRSAHRAWQRALRDARGDTATARAALTALEARLLLRDAPAP